MFSHSCLWLFTWQLQVDSQVVMKDELLGMLGDSPTHDLYEVLLETDGDPHEIYKNKQKHANIIKIITQCYCNSICI